jgi:RecA/RadA recombinase
MDKEQEKAAKARDTALNGALGQIEREFGKGSIMRMGDPEAAINVKAVPTGALSLDLALGVGGLPRGRVVEIFGPESSGKTTLVYHVLAQAQRQGGICAFIDAEHAMDPEYARRIGVDVDELLVSQPDHGEQALEIADVLIRSGAIDVVAIDSVAAPFRPAEFDITYGEGITHEGCLLDLALEHDLVSKSGSFFSYGELRLGQGRNNTKQYLAENRDLAGEIEAKLFAELGVDRKPAPPQAVPDLEDEVPAEEAAPARKAA